MQTASWPANYALHQLAEVDSTNEEARRLAMAGEGGPIWITASRQTAGRGRRGRAWISPPGNLAASLLLRPPRSAAECAQLSFLAAIAAHDALSPYTSNHALNLKWPNDVLLNGRKLSGLLLESVSNGQTTKPMPDWLIIGIGINLEAHPEGMEFPATSLTALGLTAPPASTILTELAASFAKWYEIWLAEGFAPIRDAWLARAGGLGDRIRARLSDGELWGVFEGIDQTGALILREQQNRIRTISAGEIFFD